MPRPAKLSRDRIVLAALELADEVGADGITMRALARRLDVDPMAVYRHVAGKDDLLGAMCDAILADVPEIGAAESWETAVIGLTDWLAAVLTRRPALIPVLAGAPATPAALALAARAIRVLADAGADEALAARSWSMLFALTLGHAAVTVAYEPPADVAAIEAAARSLTAPEDLPLLPAAGRLLTVDGNFAAVRDLALAGVRSALRSR